MKFTKQVCLVLMCVLCSSTVIMGQENTQNQDIQNEDSAAETELGPASGEEERASSGRIDEAELEIRDTDAPGVQMEEGLTQFSVWDFLRMFLILGGVIAAIYGVFFVLKRMGNPHFQGNSLISVISTQNLQGNRSLHLVEVGNEVFLIGSSEGGVELVGKIEDQETLDQVKLFQSEMRAGGQSFQRSFRNIFGRGEGGRGESHTGEETEESASASAFFMQKQRERLKNL